MSRKKSTRTQEHKSIRTLETCTLMICVIFCQGSANSKADNTKKDSGLQVYLPREVTIKDSNLSLGRVSIIRGQESLVAKASEIALGRISVPGQKIVIDRAMVLSRLACNGIPASKVTFTGAEKITVKQQEQTIRSIELVKLASSFLEKKSSRRFSLWIKSNTEAPIFNHHRDGQRYKILSSISPKQGKKPGEG